MKHAFKDKVKLSFNPIKDKFGQESYASCETYLSRVVFRTKRVVSIQGADIMADGTVLIPTDISELAIGSKLVFEGISYQVVGVSRAKDIFGNVHHITVTISQWVR